MRYWEIHESMYNGKKDELLQQIAPPIIDGSFTYQDENRPRLTLRHLQKYRMIVDKEKRERMEHLALLPIMYADPSDCDSKKETHSNKGNDKIETKTGKLAMKAIKAREKREQAASISAVNSIKAG